MCVLVGSFGLVVSKVFSLYVVKYKQSLHDFFFSRQRPAVLGSSEVSIKGSRKGSLGDETGFGDKFEKMRGNSLRSSRPANSMEQDSFESFDELEDMLVMSANSLNLNSNQQSSSSPNNLNVSGEEDELPKSVIVTNVDMNVFDDTQTKSNFEIMFREYDQSASFHYLRSFRRIRVDFESNLSATMAKQKLDNTLMGNNAIHCYLIQVRFCIQFVIL